MTDKAVTYTSYLRIDELLALQTPLSAGPEHDEMLFIVIHQVYELWFRQLLHEAALLQRHLDERDDHGALHTLGRIRAILKTVVAQIDVLETMTPRSFASFRDRLSSASGFQSAQFREWEAVLGRRDPTIIEAHPPGPARDRIEAAMARPSLHGAFLAYVGVGPGDDAVAVLARVYRTEPLRALVCERMVDLDEGVQEWRYRHVKMVERTIGDKPGTGGSAGAGYLRSTLFAPAFPALWAVRAEL